MFCFSLEIYTRSSNRWSNIRNSNNTNRLIIRLLVYSLVNIISLTNQLNSDTKCFSVTVNELFTPNCPHQSPSEEHFRKRNEGSIWSRNPKNTFYHKICELQICIEIFLLHWTHSEIDDYYDQSYRRQTICLKKSFVVF